MTDDEKQDNIQVIALTPDSFQVTVKGDSTTVHEVTLTDAYRQSLRAEAVDKIELIRQSFVFLLAREPNTSILRRFDLSVIGHYFPEYEPTIRKNRAS